MRSIFNVLCLVAVFSNCFAQNDKKTFFSHHLEEDLDVLSGVLAELHTGLYWYRSKEETYHHLKNIRSSLHDEMTEIDFYKLIAPFVSKIGCGHTRLRLSDSTRNKIFSDGRFLPLALKFIDDKTYVFRNYGTSNLIDPGDQVLSINGISIDSLKNRMLDYQIGDGFIETVKLRALDIDWKYNFAYYHFLLFGEHSKYLIQTVKNSGDSNQVLINSLKRDEMIVKESNQEPYNPANLTLNTYPSNETAILRVRLFYDWKAGKKKYKFDKELQRYFEQISSLNIKNLIIDVRDNPGGRDDYGLELFSYLYPNPITEFKRIEFKTKESAYLQYSDRKKLYFHKHKKINDSSYIEIEQRTLNPYGPSSPLFDGHVFLIMNGNCFSTCADFTALFKSYEIGTTIGEEPGGGYYGNTSGSVIPFTLPNTKMIIWVPVNRFTTNVEEIVDFGRGTPPDYPINRSIDDWINGVDRELQFTLDFIKEQ